MTWLVVSALLCFVTKNYILTQLSLNMAESRNTTTSVDVADDDIVTNPGYYWTNGSCHDICVVSLAGQGGMTTVHLAQNTHLVRSMGPHVVFLNNGTNDLLSGYECLKCLFEFWLSLRLSLKTSLTRLHSSYQCHPYLFKKGWSMTSFILWSTDKQWKSLLYTPCSIWRTPFHH